MPRLAVVLLSGGLDSTTAAAVALRDGYSLSAITVQYGQSHQREIEAACEVGRRLGIPHRLLDARFFGEIASYSALTAPDRFAAPLGREIDAVGADIPITYVPLRNTFLLTCAAACLESEALKAIEIDGASPSELTATLIIGANAIDYSGYPDCRPEYYRAIAETIRLGSKLGTQYGVPIKIETPLIAKTKADIVRLAVELGAPIEMTWSCYGPGPEPCSRCDSCLLRARAFAEAGLVDPVLAHGSTGSP